MSQSVIVIAENSTIEDGEGAEETEQTEEIEEGGGAEETEETGEIVEGGKVGETEETTSEPVGVQLTIDGTYFNHNPVVTGEVTGIEDGDETVGFTVFEGEEIRLTYSEVLHIKDNRWQHELDISSLSDGQFLLKATIDGTDSNIVGFTVDRTPPEIIIHTPLNDYINEALIEGDIVEENFSEGKFFLYTIDSEEPIKSEIISSKSFVFLLEELEEGQYYFTIEARDLAGNERLERVDFIFDETRPFIAPGSLFPAPNMAQVPLALEESDETLTVSVKIIDNNELLEDYVVHLQNSMMIYEKGSETAIDGMVTFENDESGNAIIMFIPSVPDVWKPNQKYYVFISPFLKDNAGNLIHPRSWSFTTETNTTVESPHGNYLNNTNTCKTCHDVHTAPRPRLEGPNLELVDGLEEHLEQINDGSDGHEEDPEQVEENLLDAVNGYCMACHDGTVASPMVDHIAEGVKSDHNKTLVDAEGAVISQSCGNCHNVHLASHPDNPNMLKDRFTFDHDGVDNVGFIDSSVQLCESCHERDSLERRIDERVTYEFFSYRNWNSSLVAGETFGSSEDYLLCLRCHNDSYSDQYENIDIATFYEDGGSGHFITMAEGQDQLPDGSFLNGYIPCADCHDTHSSGNDRLIKNELGHNWPVKLENWERTEERAFCLSCHNNETELYGLTVPLNFEIDGHMEGDPRSCATCHGGATQSFREVAHAPVRLTTDD